VQELWFKMVETDLKTFCENESFGSDAYLKDGDTWLMVEGTTVEPIEQTYKDGTTKLKYQIKSNNKTIIVGPQVMEGIKEALKKGFLCVRITKTGENLNTKYTVVGKLLSEMPKQ
jgi:hypothetical protein